MNKLYYGDNIDILRKLEKHCADLIYLDPPFNSDQTYAVTFKTSAGQKSDAQIEAFKDTWTWTTSGSGLAFDDVLKNTEHVEAANLLRAFRSALGDSDIMAYLAMMCVRLVELHRVLKDTGSLYLHCDPTASHYLKIYLMRYLDQRTFLERSSGSEQIRVAMVTSGLDCMM